MENLTQYRQGNDQTSTNRVLMENLHQKKLLHSHTIDPILYFDHVLISIAITSSEIYTGAIREGLPCVRLGKWL